MVLAEADLALVAVGTIRSGPMAAVVSPMVRVEAALALVVMDITRLALIAVEVVNRMVLVGVVATILPALVVAVSRMVPVTAEADIGLQGPVGEASKVEEAMDFTLVEMVATNLKAVLQMVAAQVVSSLKAGALTETVTRMGSV
jgi:hypothetical protein